METKYAQKGSGAFHNEIDPLFNDSFTISYYFKRCTQNYTAWVYAIPHFTPVSFIPDGGRGREIPGSSITVLKVSEQNFFLTLECYQPSSESE